jgi:endonuclease-3
MAKQSRLSRIRRRLLALHGEAPGVRSKDPFSLVLREQVAYLADDEKRDAACARLEQRVGLTPGSILGAKEKLLVEIAASGGGIAPEQRAARMRASAEQARSKWQGDLGPVLRLPVDQAVKEPAKFPMIGRPGAEKILLFTGAAPLLALESNGLRVLERLGYGMDEGRYEKTYVSVQAAATAEVRRDGEWLRSLHHALRRHGQTICRRTRPACPDGPVSGECAYFQAGGSGGGSTPGNGTSRKA